MHAPNSRRADTAPDHSATPGFSDAELEALRRETPLIAAGKLHLNHAGASPPPRPVLDAVSGYLERESVGGGYETAAAESDRIAAVYDDLARLVGGESDEIAWAGHATEAFATALSSFDFAEGDVIVTSRSDYVSNHLMFLVLERRRGVRLEVVRDAPEGGIDAAALEETLARLERSRQAKLVSLSWMPTNSGLLQPAAEVGALCRAYGVDYLLDACQVVGPRCVDVAALGCDLLAATGRKYLRGPRGTGFLWVSRRLLDSGRHPMALDLAGAEWTAPKGLELRSDARRFESWERSYALFLGLGAAARYALEVGLSRVAERSAMLAAALRQRLGAIPGVEPLDRGKSLGAIVSVAIGGGEPGSARRLMERLRRRSIHTSVTERGSALYEFDRLGVQEALRLSPHYLNTEDEIEAAAEAVEELL